MEQLRPRGGCRVWHLGKQCAQSRSRRVFRHSEHRWERGAHGETRCSIGVLVLIVKRVKTGRTSRRRAGEIVIERRKLRVAGNPQARNWEKRRRRVHKPI